MSVDEAQIASDVSRALLEDVGSGDVTADLLAEHLKIEAEIVSRQAMVVCGTAWVNEVFQQVDTTIDCTWQVSEKECLTEPSTLAIISGHAKTILTAERTALNFLQTLSGTATQTQRYVKKLQGFNARLLDTRKTIPGLRLAQKYAVQCGGGVNHRMGLYDAFLIKENHIKACGSISNAIALARTNHSQLLLEIEVETIEQLAEAIDAQPDRIMLDNFNVHMLQQAVAMNQSNSCQLEASGGIDIENIAEIAATGVDFISVGAITKSVSAIDLSLLIRKVL